MCKLHKKVFVFCLIVSCTFTVKNGTINYNVNQHKICAKGGKTMIKSFSKSIAMVLALVFMISLVPFSALAAETNVSADLEFINWAWARNNNDTGNAYYNYTDTNRYAVQLCGAGGSNERRAYTQLDLSGYEEILENESTSVSINFKAISSSDTFKIKNAAVYAMDDSTDAYPEIYYSSDAESKFEGDPKIRMSYKKAESMGLHNYAEKGVLLASRSDASVASWTFDVDAANLAQQLQTGIDNGIVSLTVEGTNASGSSYIWINETDDTRTKAVISYNPSEIDNQAYVDKIAENYQWSEVSDMEIDAISGNIELPAEYRGADVTWSSNDSSVVEDDGTVHFGKGVQSATLTATLCYKGIDESAVEAVATKDFTVSVTSEEAKEILIPFTNYGHSRSDKPNNIQKYSTNSSYSSIHYISASGLWYGYAQLDLSGYEEILNNESTKAELNMVAGNGFTSYAFDFKAYLAPDSADGYKYDEVAYKDVNALGILDDTRPVLFEDNDDVYVSNGTLISGEANLENLATVLGESGTNGLVTVWFAGETGEVNGKSQGTNFRINDSRAGLLIKYYESEIDAEGYLEKIKDDVIWENLSSDSVDAVKNNLPTYFAGASVSWSSEDDVITPDGKITPPMGANADVTLTATVDYKGYTFTKDFDVTLAAAEPVTVQVPFINYASHRSDKPSETGSTNANKYISTGSSWKGTVQVDLSEYEEILRTPHASVEFKTVTGNSFSTGLCYDFKFIVLPDSVDNSSYKSLTYTQASALGLWNAEGKEILFARSDATELKGTGHTVSGVANKEALIAALNGGYTNGLVSFGVIPGDSGETSAIQVGNAASGLYISYYQQELDSAKYLDSYKEEFTWDNLTADSAAAVENVLPTYFRGMDITWTSEEGLVNSDGTLNYSREEELVGTATAVVTYNDVSFEKTFDITLAKYLPTVITITGATATYIDAATPSDAAGDYNKCFDNYRVESQGLYRNTDRMMFLKWDLKGYEAILDAAINVAVKWKNKSFTDPKGITLTIMNNVNDTWHNSNLTYDIAVETGMYTDPGVYSETDISLATDMYITSPGLLEGFRTALAQNPENSIVSAKMVGQKWNAGKMRSNSRTYDLEITYYEDDVKAEESYIEEKVSAMPWSAVSEQSIDEVLLDLDLPASFYGKDVVWSSSDETVISSSGEVAKVSEDKNVKLTATVDGKYTKEFDVTVSSKAFTVNAFSVCSNGSKAYMDYAEAKIYATEEVTVPLIAVATYRDGKLTDIGDGSANRIKFERNYTIKPGVNIIRSDYILIKGTDVKVFFWGGLESEAGENALKPVYAVNNK